jgi:hypothetical protein
MGRRSRCRLESGLEKDGETGKVAEHYLDSEIKKGKRVELQTV